MTPTSTPPAGMPIERRFTQPGTSAYHNIQWQTRQSKITNPDGSTVFEMRNAEIPSTWSQVASDIIISKYFRKAGVPQTGHAGQLATDHNGDTVLGAEKSAKAVFDRLAETWRHWGEQYGYFATAEDAQTFEDELKYMLAHQVAAPNSPQWFNTGLAHNYGIEGTPQGFWYVNEETGETLLSEDAYSRPAPHACFIQSVKDDLVNDGGIMDLWVKEARLFKMGSGTGSNFSNIRGEGEPLAGGGASSGLMSFLKIGDRAAGAIKSGGTTRRAAKMVVLDMDHPDIEQFIDWKHSEEQKARLLIEHGGLPADFNGDAYMTVSGQNSNNSVRVSNDFIKAVQNGQNWHLVNRVDKQVAKTVPARELWKQVAEAAWACADPGMQYHTTINEWHTCPEDGEIRASNPCSEYMFLDDTACNLASINLVAFLDDDTGVFDIEGYVHAIRLWTTVLEISVTMAHFPSKKIAEGSFNYRTLGLGYANLGSLLMRSGVPYDSDKGRAIAAALTAILTGESYATSAQIAAIRGPFPRYTHNREHMLKVIRNHQRAAYNTGGYEDVTTEVVGIDQTLCPYDLLSAAQAAWDRAKNLGIEHGYRNAQATVLAPTGTIGLVMDCDTTGIEPDFALVKFKKLAGGGYFKIANQSIRPALRKLGYTETQIRSILTYVTGTASLAGDTPINRRVLTEKGFTAEDLTKVETMLPGIFEISHAFNHFILGDSTLVRLGFTQDVYTSDSFGLLTSLGFTKEDISKSNDIICGYQTIEGAPYLKDEHLSVFDCANRNGQHGKRFIHHTGHIKMMAAVQPFISGAISKTINMPNDVTVETVADAYMMSWEMGLKAMALYRDGSKASQPLSVSSDDTDNEEISDGTSEAVREQAELAWGRRVPSGISPAQAYGSHPRPRFVLPARRQGWTQEARVGGHKVFLRTGEYEDGTLGEFFLDLAKEGATLRGVLASFAIAVSKGLQYGVPLEEFVDSFVFQTFEPRGMVDKHPNIKMANSIIDYVFRALGIEYLHRDDLAQVPPDRSASDLPSPEEAAATRTVPAQHNSPQMSSRVSDRVESDKQGRADGGNWVPGQIPVAGVDNLVSGSWRGDSPMCASCGHMTYRSGTCYVCFTCGDTTGCS